MIHKTWVEISKGALLHNVGQFLSLLPTEVQFMAVVKSNAYGHGLREIVQILSRHDYSKLSFVGRDKAKLLLWFGVDNLDEAVVVREIAPRHPVLVLGYTQNSRLKEAAKLGARITVYNWETVRALKKLNLDARRYTLYAHIKVETGTTRQGIPEVEVVEFVKWLKKLKGIEVEGISTHFANIEDTNSPEYTRLNVPLAGVNLGEYAQKQLKRYNSVIMRLKGAGIVLPVRHTACSAATLLYPQTYGNLVRVGIGMYGLWPSENVKLKIQNKKLRMDLKPVLSWKTIVAQVKEVKKGTPVSYGLTERVQSDSRVAVLPVGYWDGYDRELSRVGPVLINSTRCKILGRVCMNMMMVDVTNAGRVKPEDEVVLIGKQSKEKVSTDELAAKLNTINYEVVTRINPLIPRLITK